MALHPNGGQPGFIQRWQRAVRPAEQRAGRRSQGADRGDCVSRQPSHGARPADKVGKEEIVGLLAAVQRYLALDHEAIMRVWEDQVQTVIAAFDGMPHVTARRNFPSEAGQPMPRAEIIFDEAGLGLTREEILKRLRQGEPCIALAAAGTNGVLVNPQTLGPGQERIVCERLLEVISSAKS